MLPQLKGIHYRSRFVYQGLTYLKLFSETNLRFQIAQKFINDHESVLDVCSADGQLEDFLSLNCQYHCIENSPQFCRRLAQRNIPFESYDLQKGLPIKGKEFDVVVMIISLCHFRDNADDLLRTFKQIGKKVVIIEDVLADEKLDRTFKRHMMNYLCQTPENPALKLFTREQFALLMQQNGYETIQYNFRYMVATFGVSNLHGILK